MTLGSKKLKVKKHRKVMWEFNNSAVATVANGKVTAKKKGKCAVTVK